MFINVFKYDAQNKPSYFKILIGGTTMYTYNLSVQKGYRLPEEIHTPETVVTLNKTTKVSLPCSIEECRFGWEVWEENEYGEMENYGLQLDSYEKFCEQCKAELIQVNL